MRHGVQKAAIWCGPAFIAIFFVGLLCAGFIPPSDPTMSAAEVATLYRNHSGMIRTGMTLQTIAPGFMVMFAAVIAIQLLRIGDQVKVLAFAQLGAGAAGVILFIYPPLFWSVAAYRPERSPELLLLLHDLGWMTLIVPFILAFFQYLATGLAILGDERPEPLFSRWVGYVNIWVAISVAPGPLAMFFKAGPFAWDGLIVFWLPASVLGTWTIIMTISLLKALDRQLV